jgi:hypothetical protein
MSLLSLDAMHWTGGVKSLLAAMRDQMSSRWLLFIVRRNTLRYLRAEAGARKPELSSTSPVVTTADRDYIVPMFAHSQDP